METSLTLETASDFLRAHADHVRTYAGTAHADAYALAGIRYLHAHPLVVRSSNLRDSVDRLLTAILDESDGGFTPTT